MSLSRFTVCAATAIVATVFLVRLHADDQSAGGATQPNTDNSTASGKTAADAKTETPAKAKTAIPDNPYIPRRGMPVDELQAYIERMQEAPASIRHRPGFAEGMTIAAERILESKPEGARRTFAVVAILDSLHQWADLEQSDTAQKRLETMAAKSAADEDKRISADAKFYLLEQRVLKSDDIAVADLPKLLDEVKESLGGQELDEKHIRIASGVVHIINRLPEEDAAKRLEEFGNLFAKSQDQQLARYGMHLVHNMKSETARASDWVGKKMEVAGTTAEGGKFELSQYKDKIVLIDFWATWCGPCRASLPGLKETYEKYHKQGFEVVGISLDNDLGALAELIEQEKIPWVNIVGEQKDGQMAFPLAEKYGINAIPTAFLIDKDGKIVADDLRGSDVEAQIEKLFAAQPAK
jgi:thiol-disulfide isomerase/thioredoxin